MSEPWIYAIVSTIIVSLVSLVGVIALALKEKFLKKILILLVSFAAGALLGDAFIHILPETVEEFGFGLSTSFAILAGMLTFFVLEKFIHWHHCHNPEHSHHKPYVFTNLAGDALHNFIDGLIIGTTYLVDIKLGMATTLAVIFHEIPQEIGDFGILVKGGLKKWSAIKLNLIFASFAVIGAAIGLGVGEVDANFLQFVMPFTAGGFIYVASTDLFPELHKNSQNGHESLEHFLLILAGIGMMLLLLLIDVNGGS